MTPAYKLGIKTLYKYRSLSEKQREHTLRLLAHDEIMLSSPRRFNDPFEARPQVIFTDTNAAISEYVGKLIANFRPGKTEEENRTARQQLFRLVERDPRMAFEQALWTIVDDYGILSLTQDPAHPLMWSHYADSHRGVCVEFNATQYFFPFAYEVRYQDDYPVVDPLVDSPPDTITKAIITKATYWRYEKEFRVVMPKFSDEEKREHIAKVNKPVHKKMIELHNGEGVYKISPTALSGVILGAKISKEDEKELLGLIRARRPPISIRKAVLKPNAFGLDLVDY